jgi:hypothetical protein
MSSGSKKGMQIYFPFLSKHSRKWVPSRFPIGAPIERDTRLQGIFIYLLIDQFISKGLKKGYPSIFPKSRAPLETDAHSKAFLSISFRVPSKGALPRGPPHWASSESCLPGSPAGPLLKISAPFQSLFYPFFRVPSKGAFPRGSLHRAPIERVRERYESTPGCPTEPPWSEMPISRAFLS